ncbi:DUF4435 domain-containing protein [Bacillus wiedmannii]|uniref:ATPase AAA-type core domain-containing protein n=1 Tax=Bacillus wiedmannii TaxID=1890302 RepID=A0A2B5I724_9BACI|nr:AAA family ATPase [Bacillus wiedmannii]PEM44274.1 hypothetical protein CN618_29085 [Bacillus wiedmannii]PFZ20620.1 hypothetical protein COL66_28080 [Bacillus wiedmannii]
MEKIHSELVEKELWEIPINEALNQCIEKIELLSYYYKWFYSNMEKMYDLGSRYVDAFDRTTFDLFFKNIEYSNKELENSLKAARIVLNTLEQSDEITSQYLIYLENELLNINWGKFNYIDYHFISRFNQFKQNIEAEKNLQSEDFQVIQNLNYIISYSMSYKDELVQKVSSISIFNRIQYFKDNNLVIIGPNGSGKSRFARSFKGKLGENKNYTIISAQHLLIFDPPNNINLSEKSREVVSNFQKYDKLGSDYNIVELFKNDFSNLVLALIEEKNERQRLYYEKKEDRKTSILDYTIEIWESLITHRNIVHNEGYSLEVNTFDGETYVFNQLSDGEKAIFYYIAHVLLAEKYSYILIDEPENHLHLSICIKLWDILEQVRSDCKFIYITHNLDFAVSRNDKKLLWNKNFIPPFDWEVEEIKSDEMIPDIMLLEIMGSRRDVIFCEGDDRNSLDYKIYSRLFSNYNVIPVSGHDNVINYCKSFNNNKGLGRMTAYGIIDGDTWTQEEISSLAKNNIIVLPYNEIENALCEINILKAFVSHTAGKEEHVLQFKEEFFKKIHRETDKIAIRYANNRINNFLKHNLFKENKNIEDLKKEVEEVISASKIEAFYQEMQDRILSDLNDENYEELIKYVDVKKSLTRELANKIIINNFEERFITLLDSEQKFKSLIDEEIVKVYFKDLVEME